MGPLGNVDVRSLSNGPATSLTEAGGEEDDEQNCLPSSGTLGSSQVGVMYQIFKPLYSLLLDFSQSGTGIVQCRYHYYFGGARSKGFATLRNVSKLQFFDKIGHAKSVGFRFYSAI